MLFKKGLRVKWDFILLISETFPRRIKAILKSVSQLDGDLLFEFQTQITLLSEGFIKLRSRGFQIMQKFPRFCGSAVNELRAVQFFR